MGVSEEIGQVSSYRGRLHLDLQVELTDSVKLCNHIHKMTLSHMLESVCFTHKSSGVQLLPEAASRLYIARSQA